MLGRKTVLALFLVAVITLSIISLVAATIWGLSEEEPLQIFGYDVYKFEGSGHYAIFYPMPNGTIKLLKTGKVGMFPTFVKVPRDAWIKEYANKGDTLKATPTPIVIFVNERGLGIASLKGSRVKLKELEIPETSEVAATSTNPCPKDYIPEGYRYCIPKDPTSNWIKIIASKVVIDEISFLGLRIDNHVLKDINFDMRLFLSEATYSHWTAGIDVGPVTLITTKFGESFRGKGLTTGEYTEMPLVLTYPLEILTTGSYTIYETPDGGQKYFESNPGSTFYVPSITREPHYLEIPSSADSERIWINQGDGRRFIIDEWLTESWHLSSESSFSIPIGPAAVKALEKAEVLKKYPQVRRILNSISLTIGFHKTANQMSMLIYSLQATPREDCYALRYYQKLDVAEDYNKVKVPIFMVTVTNGKSPGFCDPRTGHCTTSTDITDKE
ncbi:MAG: hypothetical protein PWQ95_1898 [Thermococcaceae archaeon]|nr:hypothetical protein [Thermococcaceae archaeon]